MHLAHSLAAWLVRNLSSQSDFLFSVCFWLIPDLTGVNTIYSAMDRIMLDTDQCVKFRPKLNHDIDYLRIFPGDG